MVRFYNAGGKRADNRDPLIKPLGLNDTEVGDLVAFLHTLTEGSGQHGTSAPGGKAPTPTPATGTATADAAAPSGAEGTLSGQFRFATKPPKVGLVYFSEDKGLEQPLTIDQDGKQFHKQMVVASPGAPITFKNSANISHNIYASDPRLNVKFDLGLALPESDFSKTQPVSWTAGEVLKVGCKIHPNMRVYVASLASRYYQTLEFNDVVTNFEFKAPAGKLTKVAVWLPQYDKIEVPVRPGEHKEIELRRDGAEAGTVVLERK